MTKSGLFILIFSLFSIIVSAQKGTVKGNIIDKATNETLIGATVMIEKTNIGAVTDIDGNYFLTTEVGTYNLVVSYVGFQAQTIKDVRIERDAVLELNIELTTEQSVLKEVVVTSVIKKQSIGSLVNLQQRSPSFVTGIVSEDMRRSPDRTTADVLKRVSGTAIQDNKFVVIRGLADRYNTALINGLALPSTEPDRKAFAFDIFPSGLLDNLIIYKTATPDLPGEFAGGVISLNTKEIPEEGFTTFSIGTSYNSQTTGKEFQYGDKGKLDWLGIDDGTRALPSTFPAFLEDNQEAFAYSKSVPNDWNINTTRAMRPAQSYQLSFARNRDIFGRRFGSIAALSYTNTPRIQFNERNDFNVDKSQLFGYNDKINKENTAIGALLNFAYYINPLNKIQFNNTFTNTADQQFVSRVGEQIEQTRSDLGYGFFFANTSLLSNQLIGEHALKEGKMKIKWGLSHNDIDRNIPSYRRMLYNRLSDEPESQFVAFIPPGSPSPNYAGRFYGKQNEKNYVASLDITLPYQWKSLRNNLKVGGLIETKDRAFSARNLGYSRSSNVSQEILTLPMQEIFKAENITPGLIKLREATDRSDSYDAGSFLAAGYGMIEQQLTSKLKLVGGVRIESYNQHLNSFKIKSSVPVIVDTTFLDILPSANLTYALNEKSNLRFSISRTVARPNFREIAPFAFFDFLLDAAIVGEPSLTRTKILNLDAKYELFPGLNQSIAISAFYKHFDAPIEQIYNNSQGAGTRTFLFQNATAAKNLGAELEFRFKGNTFMKSWKQAENFTLFSNLAYIYSEVDQSALPGAIVRGLQGQSPYIINVGLTYFEPNSGFGSTLMANRIGRRIWAVGQDQYKHTFEAPRTVLDWQVTKRLFKKGEIKLNISDILNQYQVFYQDQDENGRYNADQDTKIISSRFGQNVSLIFSYTF
jgi:TonB-dependent receptor